MKIKNQKTTRRIICEGLGKTYIVDANSHSHAKRLAARRYREESGDARPIDLLTFFIETRLEKYGKLGRHMMRR